MISKEKIVAGFPSYKVDTFGNIFSCFRSCGYGVGPLPTSIWRKLKPFKTGKGYLVVDLRNSGERRTRPVHQLILEAFIGIRPQGMEEVRHLNGNKLDNSLSNLAWGTRKQNALDKFAHGTCPMGEKHSKAKLKSGDIILIKHLKNASSLTNTRIGEIFGVGKSAIWSILHGINWKKVGS